MEERFTRSPAKARLPGQAGEEPAAEVSLKPPLAPDEMQAPGGELTAEVPSTAAELVTALLPLGDLLTGQETGRAARTSWLGRLQRLGLAAVRGRVRG
jgi:hypothetical protein